MSEQLRQFEEAMEHWPRSLFPRLDGGVHTENPEDPILWLEADVTVVLGVGYCSHRNDEATNGLVPADDAAATGEEIVTRMLSDYIDTLCGHVKQVRREIWSIDPNHSAAAPPEEALDIEEEWATLSEHMLTEAIQDDARDIMDGLSDRIAEALREEEG